MVNTTITSKVLDSISSMIKSNGYSKSGRALVVFNGSSIDLDLKLKYLQDLKQKGLNYTVGFSFMAEKILDTNKIIKTLNPIEVLREEDIFKLQSIVNKHSIIIGPNITINTLSKVTLGMIDSFIPNLIWTFLYKGKKVYLDFSSVRYYLGSESKSIEISDITNKYIQTIVKMGAVEIDKDYTNIISIPSTKQTNNIKNDKKDLITEKDIVNMSSSKGVLILEKGTLITPLAKDKARELGIEIQKK